jgi:anaerobic magnesium-protoporphyrin IX monomethyl ester cyclase
MNRAKVSIISGLGEKKYSEKYNSLSEIHKHYWENNFLRIGNTPVDVLDYYYISRGKESDNQNNTRHIYVNGIVINNYLSSKGFETELFNSVIDLKNNYEKITETVIFIFSTSFEGGNYPAVMESEIQLLRDINPRARIIIGGLGLYNAYLNYKSGKGKNYESIIRLAADHLIFSPSGLALLEEVLNSEEKNNTLPKVIIDENPEIIQYDYTIHNLTSDLQSPHSVISCSKGCLFNCSFCCYNFIQNNYIEFPLEQIKENLDQITSESRSTPLKFLRISDECLNYNEDRFIQIVQMIKRKNIRWCCFLRGDLLTDNQITALAESNCDFVSMGLESASEVIQNNMNKSVNPDVFLENTLKLKNAGITVVVSIIVGFYGETKETIKQTVDYLHRLNPDLVKLNIWSPLPDEKDTRLSSVHGLQYTNGKWKHDTMSLEEAYNYATEYFHKDRHLTVLPPETSIFDQWPQLATEGLKRSKILNLFREYHIETNKLKVYTKVNTATT